jgi:hypothetical protein
MTLVPTVTEAADPVPLSAITTPSGTQPPAHVALVEMVAAIWTARAVYAAAHLGIADLLSAGARTSDDLAPMTGTHAASLYRLLRALASRGVLTEIGPRRFALTSLGEALRSGAPGAARATTPTIGGDWQWKAWDNFLYSLETGKSALGKVCNAPLFEYLAAHPQDGANFNDAMVGIHGAVAPAVVAAYDFSSFRTIVDLGGGTGTLLSTILSDNNAAHGILFELPATASQARHAVQASGLATRCTVVEGDFFKEVPEGQDAYIMSHVLHDWTDEQAATILRNCRRAIAVYGRLLIVEAVLPSGDTPHYGKLMDLLMLTVTGGVERSADEFAELLSATGFRLSRVISTSTHQSIIEAVPV